MTPEISAFVAAHGPVFCLDIGSGTQDGLLALPEEIHHNWPRFVLPSPQRKLEEKIRAATAHGEDIWLTGENMGGGFQGALKDHLAEGLHVSATASAALAIHDDPDTVRAMGVMITPVCPEGARVLHTYDYSPVFWEQFFRTLSLPEPETIVISAQDHGYSLTGNRQFRIRMWADLLARQADPAFWLTRTPLPSQTRLLTIAGRSGGIVADTGTGALLAFLCDCAILDRSFRTGITLVNCGNTHVLAALVYRGTVRALYEHHTGLLTEESLAADLREFRLGWLPCEQVQAARGHGTVYADRTDEAGGFEPTYVTGPARERFSGIGRPVDPCGSMMTAGCFGLLSGAARSAALL